MLSGCWVTAAVRCAPPANKPTHGTSATTAARGCVRNWCCSPTPQVIVCLGRFAWDAAMAQLSAPRPRRSFGHGVEASVGGLTLLGSYHVSQQNTFTGRLTEPMLDAVFARAVELGRAPVGG